MRSSGTPSVCSPSSTMLPTPQTSGESSGNPPSNPSETPSGDLLMPDDRTDIADNPLRYLLHIRYLSQHQKNFFLTAVNLMLLAVALFIGTSDSSRMHSLFSCFTVMNRACLFFFFQADGKNDTRFTF